MLRRSFAALIERAQFAFNSKIYQQGAFKAEIAFDGSWLEWFIYEIECFHGEFGDESADRSKSSTIHEVRAGVDELMPVRTNIPSRLLRNCRSLFSLPRPIPRCCTSPQRDW